jgi:2-polyprenyl-6-methoxyphenol hydroxylase-like FAD-dependent oxidoreductase
MPPASRRPRALVIGGSIAGLCAASLLLRQGWEVDVFEQSADKLEGRGAGIMTHPGLFDVLRAIGIAVDDTIGVPIEGRIVFDRDGTVIGRLPLPQVVSTWGRLYAPLKAAFPAQRYHMGHSLERVSQTAKGGAVAHFAGGDSASGDLLIGADGLRSAVRACLLPEVQPVYAGYVAWRGLVDENALSAATHRDLMPHLGFCLRPREHMAGYPAAGFANSTRPGERCYNFVWYRAADEAGELPRLCTDARGRVHDKAIPPPLIRAEVVAEMQRAAEDLLSPQYADVVRKTRQPFFQVIFDLESPRIVFDRVALIGDAAFVARPHCGMGTTKAACDAMCLAHALRDANDDIPAALARYQADRARYGAALVAHGRELGAHLEGRDTPEARFFHSPEGVMKTFAITRDYP